MICHLGVELEIHDLFQSNVPKQIGVSKVIQDMLNKNPKTAVGKYTKVMVVKEMPGWVKGVQDHKKVPKWA